MTDKSLYLAGDAEADALLASDPLALLIAMVLDQQIPMERAFGAPAELRRRIGGLDAAAIADMDPSELADAFSKKPALHRFPGSMAARVQQACDVVANQYGGNAARIWEDASSGADLLTRVASLPGFGEQKARIFIGLLGKQFGARPTGWRKACSPFGDAGTYYSVADITDAASLAKVRAHKQEMKAAAKAASAK